ncbi:MAG: von Willebrand factor type A domain-containing protein [Candidatus Zixiibacteriota bacterium]
MKRLLLIGTALVIYVLVVVTTQLFSTNTGKIRGKIINKKTKDPVAFVVVQLKGTTMGAQANKNGEYIIINVPPGKYEICASLHGWGTVCVTELTVDVNSTTVQDFSLDEAAVETEAQIVVVERDRLRVGETSDMRQFKSQSVKNMPMTSFCAPLPGGYHPPAHGGNTPPNGEPVDAMFFKHYGVNPFVSTEDDHLSTFAIDCDNASYTMTRAYLNDGNLPPEEAVRVEEFVNNFKYNFQFPHDRAFSVQLEGAPSRFGNGYQLLKVDIIGKKIRPENRKDANLTFVVDVSGSMAREDRLGMVRRSLRMLVDELTPRDNVGIVVYGSNAWTVLEPTSIRNKDKIIRAIEQLVSEGSTNAEEGIRMGYEMANRNFNPNSINRIILCSDGVANVGQTSPEKILKFIKGYADKGITLSAIGFGMGNYNDVLMEKLGDKGNGHYAYVDSWDESRRVFLENLTGMLQVIARDVKIQVDFDPNVVERYRLLGYENRDVADEKFRDDKEDGGEIGSGHTVTALYEIKLKNNANGDIGTIYVRYKDPDSFAVSEISERIGGSNFASSFDRASSDFRLAAAGAEFAEIMRASYWARDSKLSDVIDLVRAIEREDRNDQVIELLDLVAKADRLRTDKELKLTPEPLGMGD